VPPLAQPTYQTSNQAPAQHVAPASVTDTAPAAPTADPPLPPSFAFSDPASLAAVPATRTPQEAPAFAPPSLPDLSRPSYTAVPADAAVFQPWQVQQSQGAGAGAGHDLHAHFSQLDGGSGGTHARGHVTNMPPPSSFSGKN